MRGRHVHEELGAIGVGALVGHGEKERTVMLELEALIWEEGGVWLHVRNVVITILCQVSTHGRLEFTGQNRGWALTRRS